MLLRSCDLTCGVDSIHLGQFPFFCHGFNIANTVHLLTSWHVYCEPFNQHTPLKIYFIAFNCCILVFHKKKKKSYTYLCKFSHGCMKCCIVVILSYLGLSSCSFNEPEMYDVFRNDTESLCMIINWLSVFQALHFSNWGMRGYNISLLAESDGLGRSRTVIWNESLLLWGHRG